jgi:transposase
MDNASFHKSNRIKEFIEGSGCKLIFLAPYSPEHYPIEKYWGVLKKMIKKLFKKTNDITAAITDALNLTCVFGLS